MFEDSRLKIGRAEKHIADLDSAIKCCQSSEYYVIREYFEAHTGKKFIEHGFAKQIPVNDMALIIGDAVHNLKTALDYSWLHIIRKLVPNAVRKFAKFPVYPSALDLENSLGGNRIQTASPDLYDLIVSKIKPYEGGNASVWVLHRLDISDKHRLLTPLLEVGITSATLENDKGSCEGFTAAFTQGSAGPWRIPIKPDQTLKDYSSPSILIVFEQATPVSGQHVSPILHGLSESVISLVETLEAFLESQTRE